MDLAAGVTDELRRGVHVEWWGQSQMSAKWGIKIDHRFQQLIVLAEGGRETSVIELIIMLREDCVMINAI